MTESFFYSLKFIDDYLNEKNLDQSILVDNVESYSLFDILKIQDYEKMILYIIDMGL